MRNPRFMLLGLGLLLLGVVGPAWAEENDRPPLIVVSGQGEVRVKPDMAVLRLGAEAQADNAADAQQQVNQTVNAVIEAVKKHDIPARKIQTSSLSLHPVYSQANRMVRNEGGVHEPKIVGYRASNVITIQIDDLPKIGDVIDQSIVAGANQVQGLMFGLQNDAPPRIRAMQDAVGEARNKAEAVAEALGVQLGAVYEAAESSGFQPMPMVQPMMRMAAMESAGAPIAFGELKVTASVTLKYVIAPKQ